MNHSFATLRALRLCARVLVHNVCAGTFANLSGIKIRQIYCGGVCLKTKIERVGSVQTTLSISSYVGRCKLLSSFFTGTFLHIGGWGEKVRASTPQEPGNRFDSFVRECARCLFRNEESAPGGQHLVSFRLGYRVLSSGNMFAFGRNECESEIKVTSK